MWVLPTSQTRLSKWGALEACHRVWRTPWWCHPSALSSPQAATIGTEAEISASAVHTARAFNETHKALGLLNGEVYQLRKLALQNRTALDILTASEGGMCALVGSDCCVYVPDAHHNISQALMALEKS